ncbi:unnamed protein product [Arabis nemorensis]|uniref:Uncharacterized protein n=1 Tax=Arabis nemorensis TaxID=586526 RepID=A0A565CAJ5_9BRAS|nr:unnamed protein product [Arabis nemorensis]
MRYKGEASLTSFIEEDPISKRKNTKRDYTLCCLCSKKFIHLVVMTHRALLAQLNSPCKLIISVSPST